MTHSLKYSYRSAMSHEVLLKKIACGAMSHGVLYFKKPAALWVMRYYSNKKKRLRRYESWCIIYHFVSSDFLDRTTPHSKLSFCCNAFVKKSFRLRRLSFFHEFIILVSSYFFPKTSDGFIILLGYHFVG